MFKIDFSKTQLDTSNSVIVRMRVPELKMNGLYSNVISKLQPVKLSRGLIENDKGDMISYIFADFLSGLSVSDTVKFVLEIQEQFGLTSGADFLVLKTPMTPNDEPQSHMYFGPMVYRDATETRNLDESPLSTITLTPDQGAVKSANYSTIVVSPQKMNPVVDTYKPLVRGNCALKDLAIRESKANLLVLGLNTNGFYFRTDSLSETVDLFDMENLVSEQMVSKLANYALAAGPEFSFAMTIVQGLQPAIGMLSTESILSFIEEPSEYIDLWNFLYGGLMPSKQMIQDYLKENQQDHSFGYTSDIPLPTDEWKLSEKDYLNLPDSNC